jgi:hypothetical protein
MYFWRIKDLMSELEVRSLSERESLRYYLAHSLLVAIVAGLPDEDWNIWDRASAAASVIVVCAGILACY